jgi:hypothetical protein
MTVATAALQRRIAMKFLLLVCVRAGVTEADTAGAPDINDWLDQVAGFRETGHQLQEPATAKTVRVRDGRTLVTDGPFVELAEWVVGFDVLECADLETAVKLAAGHPVAHFGSIEVRPFHEFEAGRGD